MKKKIMSVYHKWRTIFIQIPKNASNSINERLTNRTDNFGIQHLTFFDVMHYQDPELFDSYFSFSCVRNPYDRFVSAFEFVKLDTAYVQYNINKNFDEFVDIIYKNGLNFYSKLPIHFTPQYKFISIKNVILVDEIMKVENINEDWKRIAEIINKKYSFTPIPTTIDVLNANSIRMNIPWQDYYKNEETKNKIYELYKKDFELFGYEK